MGIHKDDEAIERELAKEKRRREYELEGFTEAQIEELESERIRQQMDQRRRAKEERIREREIKEQKEMEEEMEKQREKARDGERVISGRDLLFLKNRGQYLIKVQATRESKKSKSEDQAAKPHTYSAGRRVQHARLIEASNNKSADSAEKNSVSYIKETTPYTNIARVKQSSLQRPDQSQATKTSEYHNAEVLSSNTTVELDNNPVELDNNQDGTTAKKLREPDYRKNQNFQAESENRGEQLNDSCSDRSDCSAILNVMQNSCSESNAIEAYFGVDHSDDKNNEKNRLVNDVEHDNQNIAVTKKQHKKNEEIEKLKRLDKMEPIFRKVLRKLGEENKKFLEELNVDDFKSIFDDAHAAGYYTACSNKLPLDENQLMRTDEKANLMRQFSRQFQRTCKKRTMHFSDVSGKTNKAGMRTKSFNNFINGKYRSVDTSNTIK